MPGTVAKMEALDREHLEQARTLHHEGRLEEALELLVDLLRRFPEDPRIQVLAARVHEAAGLPAEARGHYQRAIESGDLEGQELEDAMVGLGSAYRCLGRYRESAHLLERAMHMFPSNRAVQVFLAMAWHNLGDDDRACGLLLRHLAETTSDPALLRHREALLQYAPCLGAVWDQG